MTKKQKQKLGSGAGLRPLDIRFVAGAILASCAKAKAAKAAADAAFKADFNLLMDAAALMDAARKGEVEQ